jgi:ABC-type proline/glycine betaine transport system substrate-binding protein
MSKNRLLANLVSDNQPLANGTINLADIGDFNVSGLQNGQTVVWNSTTNKWVNSASILNNVTITNPQLNDIVRWDGTKWVNFQQDQSAISNAATLAIALG